jgi:hypothetical protein
VGEVDARYGAANWRKQYSIVWEILSVRANKA